MIELPYSSTYTYIILRKFVLNGVHVLCPKQGNKAEAFVLNRVRVSNPYR